MMIRLEQDFRIVVKDMSKTQLEMFALIMSENIGHDKTCECIKVSDPIKDEDEEEMVLVGPTDKDCSCGADLKFAKHVESVLRCYD